MINYKLQFKKNKFLVIFITSLFFLLNQSTAFASVMQSTNYQLQSDSLNFGGDKSSSSSYIIQDAVGEVGTGNSESSNYINNAGYLQSNVLTVSDSGSDSDNVTNNNSSGSRVASHGAVNVVDFKVSTDQKSILLSWVYPFGSDIVSVRILRSKIFYPSNVDDGEIIFEGNSSNIIDHDVITGVNYYYTLFAKNSKGEYSSGVLANGLIIRQEITTVQDFTEPFANVPNTSKVDKMTQNLTLDDFEYIQDGKVIEHSLGIIPIDGKKNILIRLPYNKVPEVLKTIAISLTDQGDKTKVFTFLLRINKDKTYYEALIAPLNKSGSYNTDIIILNYKNQGMKRLHGEMRSFVFEEIKLSNIDSENINILFMVLGVMLVVLSIVLLVNLINKRATITFPLVLFILFGVSITTAYASFNKQINYQGKLLSSSGTAVSDANYNIRYKLYTSSNGGSPIWTETLCYSPDSGTTCDGTGTDSRISVSSGLFSTMLGTTTLLESIDFNQTLYLGVEIGGTGSTPSWDGEMSPRKKIGAVPAAFEADRLDGLSSEQFLRSDTTNSTSTSSTFLTLVQTGVGNIADFIGQGSATVMSILSNGNVGIGTTSPYAALSVAGSTGVVANIFTATSTNATSTFAGGLSAASSLYVFQNGNVGLGTSNPGIQTLAGRKYLTVQGSSLAGVLELTSPQADADGNTVGVIQTTDINSTSADKRLAGIFMLSKGSTSNNRGGMILFSTKADNGSSLPTRMNVSSSGVYIANSAATATSTNRLDVNGNIAIGATYALTTAPTSGLIVEGNVGVGTTSPNWKLSVAGSRPSISITDTSGGTNLKHWLLSSMGGNLYIGTSTDSLATSSIPAISITNTGTTTINGRLNILSTTRGGDGGIYLDGSQLLNTINGNIFFGQRVGNKTTTGSGANVSIGTDSMQSLTTGNYNLSVGSYSQSSITSGQNNTTMGYAALQYNATGSGNIAVGSYSNTYTGYSRAGVENTSVGFRSGENHDGNENTFVGAWAGSDYALYLGGGSQNVSVGNYSSYSNNTGASTTVVGYKSMYSNTSGSNNSSFGIMSLFTSINTSSSTSIGAYSLKNSNSKENTALGAGALFGVTTGNGRNIGIGSYAGSNITTGSGNIIIGNYISATSSTAYNTLNIGNLLFGNGLDGVGTSISTGNIGIATSTPWRTLSVVGTVALNGLTSSATGNALCIATNKDITDSGGASCTPSSIRFKENVSILPQGYALDELSKLKVVNFDYKEKQPFETNHSYGLIAEDVEKVDNNLVDYGYDGKPISLHFEKITGLLVQAVQEQQGEIGNISSTTSKLELSNNELAKNNSLVITNINSRLDNLENNVNYLSSSTIEMMVFASSTLNSLSSSTVDSLINSQSFISKIIELLVNYLNTATVSIKSIFVRDIHVEEKICIDDVCIDKDQLKALINQSKENNISTKVREEVIIKSDVGDEKLNNTVASSTSESLSTTTIPIIHSNEPSTEIINTSATETITEPVPLVEPVIEKETEPSSEVSTESIQTSEPPIIEETQPPTTQ